jgi:hypothetical protein
MLIMSCYTGLFNVRSRWQFLNTGPRFYLLLIRRTGWLWIYTSRTTDGRPFKPKKLSVPFLYPGVPAGLTPCRGLVPLGRRNLVPILPSAHSLGGYPPPDLYVYFIKISTSSICAMSSFVKTKKQKTHNFHCISYPYLIYLKFHFLFRFKVLYLTVCKL